MSATTEEQGVVIDRGGVRWVDTYAMTWQPVPGPDGEEAAYYRKVLARTEEGVPRIFLQCMPPGFPVSRFQPPYRHYHRTVRESCFLLHGEFPGAEYESAEQDYGDLVVKQAGWFMDRDPGSLHGFEPELPNPTGCVFLMWNDGPGMSRMGVDSEDFEEETVDVPYPPRTNVPSVESRLSTARPDGSGVVIDRGGVRWIDTRAMEWEEFWNGESGHYRKILRRDDEGNPIVFLHYLPPGSMPASELPYRHYHRTVREFGFVLEGELPGAEYESAEQLNGTLLQKKKGWFIERQPGSIHGVEAGQTTNTGCLLFCWVDGPGSWIGDENFSDETVHVAYGDGE
jgi:hypothetical protein